VYVYFFRDNEQKQKWLKKKKETTRKNFFLGKIYQEKYFSEILLDLFSRCFFFSDHVLFYFFDKTTFIFSFVCRSV